MDDLRLYIHFKYKYIQYFSQMRTMVGGRGIMKGCVQWNYV